MLTVIVKKTYTTRELLSASAIRFCIFTARKKRDLIVSGTST